MAEQNVETTCNYVYKYKDYKGKVCIWDRSIPPFQIGF